MSKLSEKIEKRIEELAGNRFDKDDNGDNGASYYGAKVVARAIATELFAEIERLRGALDKVNWHDMDCQKEFKNGFCGCPGYFAEQAITASIQRFGESKKEK